MQRGRLWRLCTVLFACLVLAASPTFGEVLDLNDIKDDDTRYQAAMQIYGAPVIAIPRTDQSIVIDGVLDDAAWKNAATVDLAWQINPVANVPAGVSTTVYVMDDGKTLYVGFDAKTSKPEEIRAFLRKRDALFNDDYVAIGIDTQGDGSRGFQFFSNPLGVQGDALASSSGREDFSFDAIFDTGGRLTPNGYQVEFAIPLHQLRFARREGPQKWKMLFTRTRWGDSRYQDINFPFNRDSGCFVCEYKPVTGLVDIEPGKRIAVVPSFTANVQRTRDPTGDAGTDRSNEVEVGIDDFRWGITPDLSLNAAINPDFSQIEADIAQSAVNSSFVLFFPERRPFFLEGRDLFATQFNLVNTRNIADPQYGVKLSGKLGKNAYGLMSARDRVTNFLLAGPEGSTTTQIDESHQASALRYRRDIGDGSHLGVLVTERRGDAYLNRVGSVDGQYRLTKSDTIQVQWSESESENPLSLQTDNDLNAETRDRAFRFNYRHSSSSWFWNANFQQVGADFSADLGFLNSRDYQQYSANLGYIHRGQSGDFLNFMNVGWQHFDTHTEDSGDFQWRGGGPFLNFGFPRDTWISTNYFDQERMFSGVRFKLKNVFLNFRTRPLEGFSYSLNARIGDQIDVVNVQPGEQIRVSQNLEYNAGEHILLRLRHTYQELDVAAGRLFTQHLTDARVTYQFDLHNSLLLSIIYRNTDRDTSLYTTDQESRSESYEGQLLYSYQLNPQSVIFAGYSSSGIGNDELSGLEQTFDTLFVKFTYAWHR